MSTSTGKQGTFKIQASNPQTAVGKVNVDQLENTEDISKKDTKNGKESGKVIADKGEIDSKEVTSTIGANCLNNAKVDGQDAIVSDAHGDTSELVNPEEGETMKPVSGSVTVEEVMEHERLEQDGNQKCCNLQQEEESEDRIETLEEQIHSLKAENEYLTECVKEKENNTNTLNNSLEEHMDRLSASFKWQNQGVHMKTKDLEDNITTLQNMLEESVVDRSRLEHELKESVADRSRLEQKLEAKVDDCHQLTKAMEDLTTRLSEEMDAKISARETTIENVGIKNRPMNIKNDYDSVCSNQWQEVKAELDKHHDDEVKKLKLLCDIILISYDVAEKALTKLCADICNPLAMIHDEDEASKDTPLPQNLTTELTNFLKRTSDSISVDKLVKQVEEYLDSKCDQSATSGITGTSNEEDLRIQSLWPLIKEADVTKVYISSICRVAWNMVIQRPAMTLRVDGVGESWKGEQQQDLYWTSKDPDETDAIVVCYVYPSVWHGDMLKSRGKVLVKRD